MRLLRLLRPLPLLAALACRTGPPLPITEIGNPERSLGVAATPPEGDPPAALVTSAWAALGEIKLELDERYAGAHELEWETPEVTTELTRGPVEVRFRSPIATYNRVTLRPRDGSDLPPGAPAELEDYSFVVEGERGDGVPFVLRSPTEEDIVLVGSFDLDRDQTELALGFDVEVWFDPAALDAAVVEGGAIAIDPGHNADLLAAFHAALPGSITLVEDLDGDGQAGQADLVLLE